MGQEEGGSRALSRGAAWDRLAAALHWQGASRWRLGSLPRLTTSAHCLGSLPRLPGWVSLRSLLRDALS